MTGSEDSWVLGMGNAAIARGALEGNIQVATSYPGTPASEILENLIDIAPKWNILVEWSANEKVAFEVAFAAAWSGLRAITSMKQNGLFVLLDSLVNVAYTGHGSGGLVLVIADDPQAHSSTTESDTRALGHYANIPVLEPSTHQEAKDMIPYALDLAERFGIPFMVRITTRLAHTQQMFRLGPVLRESRKAVFNHDQPLRNIPFPAQNHKALLDRLEEIRNRFEVSPWNRYTGPENPELIVLTTGTGWLYANEALRLLDIRERVGLLRVATISPLPLDFIQKSLQHTQKVLVLEEFDPFLETQVRSGLFDLSSDHRPSLFGKFSGHIPRVGELNIQITLMAISEILELEYQPVTESYKSRIMEVTEDLPPRILTFCPGCPHRATYLAIHRAIKRNQNKGFVTGDIGCYSLGAFYHDLMRNQHAMGTGVGLASGFGRLDKQGLDEPVIAVIGDSTLFHAGVPALVNMSHHQANATVCVLDNQTTAMTSFQPHPGTNQDALGTPRPIINIEELLQSIGFSDVTVIDPFELKAATDLVYKAITSAGCHAIVFRRPCPLSIKSPTAVADIPLVSVSENCKGSKCRICVTDLNCPAIIWNNRDDRAQVDPALCVGCNVCIEVCPHDAIHSVDSSTQEETAR
jgi:indolepyruvate ferredoxin oxidoreductase alpha subunit